MSTTPQVVDAVILMDGDVLMARRAIRKVLGELRGNHVRAVRRDQAHYAESALRRFDDYLDLYERLGGDPDEIPDPEDAPARGDRG